MSPVIESLFEHENPEPYKSENVSLPKSFFVQKPKDRVCLNDIMQYVPSADDYVESQKFSVVTSKAKDVSTKTDNTAV